MHGDRKMQSHAHSRTFNILYKSFNDAKLADIHDKIIPIFELLGLPFRSALLDNKTPMKTKAKYSYMRALPPHFHSALHTSGQRTYQNKWPPLWTTTPLANTSISGAMTLATESVEPLTMLFHPNFLASLSAILYMMIKSCTVP